MAGNLTPRLRVFRVFGSAPARPCRFDIRHLYRRSRARAQVILAFDVRVDPDAATLARSGAGVTIMTVRAYPNTHTPARTHARMYARTRLMRARER